MLIIANNFIKFTIFLNKSSRTRIFTSTSVSQTMYIAENLRANIVYETNKANKNIFSLTLDFIKSIYMFSFAFLKVDIVLFISSFFVLNFLIFSSSKLQCTFSSANLSSMWYELSKNLNCFSHSKRKVIDLQSKRKSRLTLSLKNNN